MGRRRRRRGGGGSVPESNDSKGTLRVESLTDLVPERAQRDERPVKRDRGVVHRVFELVVADRHGCRYCRYLEKQSCSAETRVTTPHLPANEEQSSFCRWADSSGDVFFGGSCCAVGCMFGTDWDDRIDTFALRAISSVMLASSAYACSYCSLLFSASSAAPSVSVPLGVATVGSPSFHPDQYMADALACFPPLGGGG